MKVKCEICGRTKVAIISPIGKAIVCEFCDLQIITLDKCNYCGTYFSSYLEKACKCRKIEQEKR